MVKRYKTGQENQPTTGSIAVNVFIILSFCIGTGVVAAIALLVSS
mgnify:CR=1 FL=1